jgi:hypothetical protein
MAASARRAHRGGAGQPRAQVGATDTDDVAEALDAAAARWPTVGSLSGRAGTDIEPPDCCALLAAQDRRGAAVLTFDERLARAAARLGLRVG